MQEDQKKLFADELRFRRELDTVEKDAGDAIAVEEANILALEQAEMLEATDPVLPWDDRLSMPMDDWGALFGDALIPAIPVSSGGTS